MKIRIRGRFWNFERRALKDVRGTCDAPHAKNKAITVDANLVGEEELEIICHEALHAAFWDLGEESIEETAADLARILWKLGYRRVG